MTQKKPAVSEEHTVSEEKKEYLAPEITYVEFDFTERIMASSCDYPTPAGMINTLMMVGNAQCQYE